MVVCPVCQFDKPCLEAKANEDIVLIEDEGRTKRFIPKGVDICTACSSRKSKMPGFN